MISRKQQLPIPKALMKQTMVAKITIHLYSVRSAMRVLMAFLFLVDNWCRSG